MARVPDRKYSDAQREAVSALLEADHTGPQVVEMLATHGHGDLPPFEIKLSTVYDIGRRSRDRAAGMRLSPLARQPAAVATAKLVERMISIADAETMALAKDQARGKLDYQAFERMARGISLLDSAAKKIAAGQGAGSSTPSSKPDVPEPGSLAADLLSEADAERTDSREAESADPSGLPPNPDVARTGAQDGVATSHVNGQHAT